MKELVEIYTDGACSNNQNHEASIGGWAFYLSYKTHTKKGSGRVLKTTNNRMEILAIINALKQMKKYDIKTIVYTDSQYVIGTVTLGWKKNKNEDLWEELFEEISKFKDITFMKVKGHANDELNNMVDEMAVRETKEL